MNKNIWTLSIKENKAGWTILKRISEVINEKGDIIVYLLKEYWKKIIRSQKNKMKNNNGEMNS